MIAVSTKQGGIDFILGTDLTQKGRMNAVKEGLMRILLIVDPTFIVIDPWRIQTWVNSAVWKTNPNAVIVSIKINPSRLQKLNYGNEIVNVHEGVYYLYNFSLHIIARYDWTREDELESKLAYDKANAIVTYLRGHNKDPDSGIIDIVNITSRESDPSGGTQAGAHMARVIVEGYILAERPWRMRGA